MSDVVLKDARTMLHALDFPIFIRNMADDIDAPTKIAVTLPRGLCIKHGHNKWWCNIDGCKKQSVVQGLCKKHGPKRHSQIQNSYF